MYKLIKKDINHRRWKKDGRFHRIKGPALECPSGSETFWYASRMKKNGKRNIPIYYDRVVEAWFKNGEFHRESCLPAVKFSNNYEHFWENGIQYKFLEYENGTKEYCDWQNRLHRENEPAVIYPNGDCEYWQYGSRHRNDGPAVIYGDKQYWFENGEFLKID